MKHTLSQPKQHKPKQSPVSSQLHAKLAAEHTEARRLRNFLHAKWGTKLAARLSLDDQIKLQFVRLGLTKTLKTGGY